MNLRNCAQCGKLFVFINRNICPDCLAKEEEMFEVVRTYLRDNPDSKIKEVSEATEVPEDKIIRFLREGRIISGNINAGLVCETCSKPISSGYTCEECKDKLRKGIQSITGVAKKKINTDEPVKDSKGMFIAERYKK